MATITLQYDARNSVAKKFIEFITSLGLFSVVSSETDSSKRKYNAETIKAINDAKAGRNMKPLTDIDKLIKECSK